ncbi:MAG: endopeptidase [Actinomycetota bacterium]|jgi:STE24 endopeptidase|nr:endopeptidase [Actinomycetota bacterium]
MAQIPDQPGPRVSSRTALVLTLSLLTVALLIVVALATPWQPLPLHGIAAVAADPSRDFTAAQIARENAYHAAVRPPAYASLGLGLLVALALGLTPWGARVVSAVASPFGGGWGWRVVLGTIALTAIGRLVALPFDARAEVVLRRYGLSTQSWGSWATDVVKSYSLGLIITLLMVLGVVALARRSPQWWWSGGAVLAAVLVIVVSFAYPVVVEPVFNKFTPLPQGQLRTSLLSMAARDGVPAHDVLVADASRRTTSLNAYVSGFGATRRIVVYDTLLEDGTPGEVRLIVAHELGHAKARDVVWGTFVGALGVAAAVCLLALLMRWPWLLRRAGVVGPGDARATALLLALVAVIGFVSGPAQSLISRRIEARADVHSLNLTSDPTTFVSVQRRLATTNLSDLDPSPLVFGMFSTHPTAPQRIAMARTWARLHHVPVPPSTVGASQGR